MDQCNAAAPTPTDWRVNKLRRALEELLEQVESLEGYELSRDLEPYKAEAVWDWTIENAANALRETE